jgi:hypothetical protein
MLSFWQFSARAVATVAIVLGLSGSAWAVAAIGAVKRVDVDPGAAAAPVHNFGLFYLIRTGAGGFAVAWEEDSQTQTPNVYERIRYRVYGTTFAPVTAPQAANLSGAKREPRLVRVAPLGASNAYLTYALTRDNIDPGPEDPEFIREAFGQRIALGTGIAAGPRQLLNPSPATGVWGSPPGLIGIEAGVSGGRALFAWYEADEVDPVPGRFIGSAGALQPVNLDFTCCVEEFGDQKQAQLVRLQPLGTGFLANYQRNSFLGNSGTYARVFQSNGQPLAAAKYFAVNFNDTTQNVHRNVHVPQALSNGNIAVFKLLPATNPTRLVAELYSNTWQKIGGPTTLVSSFASTRYVDFEPTRDGGFFVIRTLLNNGVYTRQVRRFNASLVKVGTDYTFPAAIFDSFRIAALSVNRAVVLYRDVVGGRSQLKAQIVSY